MLSKLVICPHQMVLFGLILYISFSTVTPGQDTCMDEKRTILGSGSMESIARRTTTSSERTLCTELQMDNTEIQQPQGGGTGPKGFIRETTTSQKEWASPRVLAITGSWDGKSPKKQQLNGRNALAVSGISDFQTGCSVAVPSGEGRAGMPSSKMQLWWRWSWHWLPSPGLGLQQGHPKHAGSPLPLWYWSWLWEPVGCFNAQLFTRLLGTAVEGETEHLPSISPKNRETTWSAVVTTVVCICTGFVAMIKSLLSFTLNPNPHPNPDK